MIDPKLFTVERLLETFLNDCYGNRDKWRANAEIVPNYVSPHAPPGESPRCVVRYKHPHDDGYSFLRHSKGPRQGHSWDVYGDDYQTPELAFMALLDAVVPPCLLDKSVWTPAEKSAPATSWRDFGDEMHAALSQAPACPKWTGTGSHCQTCGVSSENHPGAPTPASRGCEVFRAHVCSYGYVKHTDPFCCFCRLPRAAHKNSRSK